MDTDDVIDVIRRSPVLSELRDADGPVYQRDLTDRLGQSKSTTHRTVTTLDELDLIRRGNDGYALTPLGEIVAAETERYRDRLSTAADLAPFLDAFETLPLGIEDVTDYSITRATEANPVAPLIRLAELTEGAAHVRVVTSTVAPQSFDVGRDRLRNGDLVTEMVLDERAFDSLVESDRYGADLARDLRETPLELRVADERIPFQLGVLDERLCLGAQDEDRRPTALLETDDEAAVETGLALYERYRENADPIAPGDI